MFGSRAKSTCAAPLRGSPPRLRLIAASLDLRRGFLLNVLMQIESLKVFCDLAETESFTKTAQINNVTQSAVSQTISALEREFRSLLVERSRKHFHLTPEGQVLYDKSKEITKTFDALETKLKDVKNDISGKLRIATVYSIGLHELPPYVRRLLKDYPHVNAHIEYRRSNQVYEDVKSNAVDLGIVAYPNRDPNLELVSLRKDPLVLICHPQHPFASLKSIKLKALNGQRLISFERDIPTRRALDRIFKHEGVKAEHFREFDNIEILKRVVEVDSGVAVVPEPTVRREVANGTLVAVPLDGKYSRDLGLIYKKSKVLSPAMKQFITLLKEPL